MNRSPVFLAALNRLIGRTMRRIQLEANDLLRFHLRVAVDRLNAARRAFKVGKYHLARFLVERAQYWVIAARSIREG